MNHFSGLEHQPNPFEFILNSRETCNLTESDFLYKLLILFL